MLKTMRASFHQLKWTLFAVIIVFILGFVFFSGSELAAGNASSQVIASVGRDQVSADRVRPPVPGTRSSDTGSMYQGSFTPELARALDLPRQVLDGMIDRKLRLEAARRLKLNVSDEELARAIVALPVFQENGQFIGRREVQSCCALAGMHPEPSRRRCARTCSSRSTPSS